MVFSRRHKNKQRLYDLYSVNFQAIHSLSSQLNAMRYGKKMLSILKHTNLQNTLKEADKIENFKTNRGFWDAMNLASRLTLGMKFKYNDCLEESVFLYAALSSLNYDVSLLIGQKRFAHGDRIYHAWCDVSNNMITSTEYSREIYKEVFRWPQK